MGVIVLNEMGNCCDSKSNDLMQRDEHKFEGKIDYNIKDLRFIEIPKWNLSLRDVTGSIDHVLVYQASGK
jgi:hypothetical protein